MKKIMFITLCLFIVVFSVACNKESSVNENPSKENIGDKNQIPNPFVDCKTTLDAGGIAGLIVTEPEIIPAGYTQDLIHAIKDELVEIIYVNGENELRFRQSKGIEDISGDYNKYKENNTLTVGNIKVITKGEDKKVSVATWTKGDYSYAITGNNIDNIEISNMISSIR